MAKSVAADFYSVAIFLMTGATWQGIILIAYGMLLISVVDNILRPIL
jgi:predicted PurR-regulated permease PerM